MSKYLTVGGLSPNRARASSRPTIGLGHNALGVHFKKLGRRLARATGTGKSLHLRNPSGHREDLFKRIQMASRNRRPLSASQINQRHRAAQPRQDEIIPTSAIRELILGVLEEDARFCLTPAEDKALNDIFNDLSKVRLPTRFSGHATIRGAMQHPTRRGTGIFGEAAQTAARHSEYDLGRKRVAAEAMTAEAKIKRSSAVKIAYTGLRAAIAYTLNDFTAPAEASDVQPFIRKGVSPKLARQQVIAREQLKSIFVLLGGRQESPVTHLGGSRRGRAWAARQGRRNILSVSPERSM